MRCTLIAVVLMAGCLVVTSMLAADDAAKPDNGVVAASGPTTAPTTQTSLPATAEATGQIKGKVVREGGGGPVTGAKVTLMEGGPVNRKFGVKPKVIAETKTDANGDFAFEKAPVGAGYSIRAFDGSQRAGAEGMKRNVSVEAGKSTDVGAITVHALPG